MSTLPSELEGTGVYATEEEQTKAFELANVAARTPVILLFGKHDLAGDAQEQMQKAVHEFALGHDLPEIQGYYGMAEDGEFIKQRGQ